jgi:hypothetical protein
LFENVYFRLGDSEPAGSPTANRSKAGVGDSDQGALVCNDYLSGTGRKDGSKESRCAALSLWHTTDDWVFMGATHGLSLL